MIIPRDKQDVQSSGFQKETHTKIVASPEMLHMLSSGVYKDKIKAVIRELSTNAYDAMVDAGTIEDKTFDVHLPTRLEPWFSIRDYGTGLSPEMVETVFINYGDSTKKSSNKFNGAMGIGSKSPFAYTRDFTIQSWYDGVTTFYNYGKNEDDIPILSQAYSTESAEHPGIEIKLAVKSEDINSFCNKALDVYKYFDKRPKTNVDLEYNEGKKLFSGVVQGLEWYYEKPVNYYSNRGSKIVMANCAYPTPYEQADSKSVLNQLGRSNFVVKVPIGTVQMTASRESLQGTPRTLKYLEGVFKEIKDDILKNFLNKIDKTKPLLGRLFHAKEILAELPNGINLNSYDVEGFPLQSRTNGFYLNELKLNSWIADCTISLYRKDSDGFTKHDYHIPFNSGGYHFLLVDKNTRISETIDNYRGKHNNLYVIRVKTSVTYPEKRFNEFIKTLQLNSKDYTYSSKEYAKLPPMVKTQGVKKVIPTSTLELRKLGVGSYNAWIGGTTRIAPETKGSFIYIETLSQGFRINSKDFYWGRSAQYLVSYLKNAKLTDKFDGTLYCCNQKYIKRVQKDPRFIELSEFVKKNKIELEYSDDTGLTKLQSDLYLKSYKSLLETSSSNPLIKDYLKLPEGNNRIVGIMKTLETLGCKTKEVKKVDTKKFKGLEVYKDLHHVSVNHIDKGVAKELVKVLDRKYNGEI